MKTINKKDNGFYNNKTNQVDKSPYYKEQYTTLRSKVTKTIRPPQRTIESSSISNDQ